MVVYDGRKNMWLDSITRDPDRAASYLGVAARIDIASKEIIAI